MTRFRDAKVCNKLATDENWRSQNTVWLQVQKWTATSRRKELCTWYCVCVVKPITTPMTTWQPRSRPTSTQSTWNSTFDMSMCLDPFVCLVLFCLRQHIHELHTTSRGSSFTCARPLMVTTWWAYLFDLESSILFYFLIFSFIFNLLHFLLHFFHYFEGRSNPAYFAWKEMDSLDDTYLLTGTKEVGFRADISIVESVRTRHVTIGTFPSQLQVWIRIANMANNADSDTLTLRLMGGPVKKVEDKWWEGSVALLKESFQLGCVSLDYLPKVYSSDRWKIGIESHRQILLGHMAPHKNWGKRGSIARNYSKVRTPRAQCVHSQI